MNILVLGAGGREHALCWKIARSPLVKKLYGAPGNAGIAREAECVPIDPMDVDAVAAFAKEKSIDLTVVGPEAPLCAGIVDRFRKIGRPIFGPTRAAAELEGSKIFTKNLCRRQGIPTAAYRVFERHAEAVAYLRETEFPLVVKADGLASGKGVVVCRTAEIAKGALEQMMVQKAFGEAGNRVVIEERLVGDEASLLALTDGSTLCVLEGAQDAKRLQDGDHGPNTGGMGAYSPTPVIDASLQRRVEQEVLLPVVHAMNRDDRAFRGCLYAGLMVTPTGPKVLEFNVRFGDPEAQALIFRMSGDIVPTLLATSEGKLAEAPVEWDPRPAVCVVVAAAGYPGTPVKGARIDGLPEAGRDPDTYVFHAGTAMKDGAVVVNGGRVLGVTARGNTLAEARERAYAALEPIRFEGMQFRRDIALRQEIRRSKGESQESKVDSRKPEA